MKKVRVFRVMLAVALLAILVVGTAAGVKDGHRAKGPKGECGPKHGLNLSDTQKEEMKALRLSFTKEMTPYKNDLGVKMAELKAASTGDNVNEKTVNNLLDEIGDIKTLMAKKKFANKQKVRALLTDDQKIMFDAHAGKGHKRGHQGKAMRQGRKGGDRQFHKGQKGHGERFSQAEAEKEIEIQG